MNQHAKWSTCIAVALFLSAHVFAGLAPRCAPVFRTDAPPKVDGVLGDACWQGLPWASGFRALGGGPAGRQTRFAMLWDAENLYVAVRMEEPNAERLVARVKRRDGSVWKDDSAELFVTPVPDRKPYFHFVANSIGTQFDEEVQSAIWNASWRIGTNVGEDYWALELAIPFEAIGFAPAEGKTLRGNVNRTRCAGGGEAYSTWTPIVGGFHDFERFGTFRLTGRAGPEAQEIAAKMDAPFRQAMEEDMRRAWNEVLARSKTIALAERAELLRGEAAKLKERVDKARKAIEKRGLLDAALSGRIAPMRKLAADLRELEYRAKIEQLLAEP